MIPPNEEHIEAANAELAQLRRDIRAWRQSLYVLLLALLVVIGGWVQFFRSEWESGAMLLLAGWLLMQFGKRLQPRKEQP